MPWKYLSKSPALCLHATYQLMMAPLENPPKKTLRPSRMKSTMPRRNATSSMPCQLVPPQHVTAFHPGPPKGPRTPWGHTRRNPCLSEYSTPFQVWLRQVSRLAVKPWRMTNTPVSGLDELLATKGAGLWTRNSRLCPLRFIVCNVSPSSKARQSPQVPRWTFSSRRPRLGAPPPRGGGGGGGGPAGGGGGGGRVGPTLG
mmetsp:Transcript_57878/g.176319  ORF Transcript_57878/g.176319 Transcript_57878/m.176319 type:complete len:200 (-) Transcript_57878:2-601(-)